MSAAVRTGICFVRIEDPAGREWGCESKSPARKLVNFLHNRKRMDWIVLSVETMMTGRLEATEPPPPDPTQPRTVRRAECYALLKGQAVGGS